MTKDIIAKTKTVLNLDGAQVVPALIDLVVFQGVPVSTIATEISKSSLSHVDKFNFRKAMAAAQRILVDIKDEKITSVLLQQTLKNLNDKHGEEYFSEAMFHVIQSSDSRLRTRLVGSLVSGAVTSDDIRDSFFEFLHIVQNLTIEDLKKLRPATEDIKKIENKSVIRPILGVTDIKSYRDYYTLPRLYRYQAVGLSKGTGTMKDSNVPLVDEELADLLLSAIQSDLLG